MDEANSVAANGHGDAALTEPLIRGAVVQIMTYLIENETAALLVPARMLARLHPHFREVMQILAIQAADEARHVQVFTRRVRHPRPLHHRRPGLAETPPG